MTTPNTGPHSWQHRPDGWQSSPPPGRITGVRLNVDAVQARMRRLAQEATSLPVKRVVAVTSGPSHGVASGFQNALRLAMEAAAEHSAEELAELNQLDQAVKDTISELAAHDENAEFLLKAANTTLVEGEASTGGATTTTSTDASGWERR